MTIIYRIRETYIGFLEIVVEENYKDSATKAHELDVMDVKGVAIL